VKARAVLEQLKTIASSDRALTVADQMILSATNLLTSLIVVNVAGPAMFGIYSVILVVVNLICGGFSSLVSGQMMLTIAASRERTRNSFARTTFGLHLFCNALVALLALAFLAVLWKIDAVGSFNPRDFIAAVGLVFALSSFEFFRQFLYVTRQFRLSVILTASFCVIHFACLAFVILSAPETSVVALAVGSLAAGYLFAVVVNKAVWRAMSSGKVLGVRAARALFARYWEQGRFGFAGLFLTWVQNQSLSLILLWHQGALVVGYYNLARLMLMPLSVFNTGLLKGLTPQFRRLARKQDLDEVARLADRQARFSLLVLAAYSMALAVLYLGAFINPFIEYIDEVWPFVVMWCLITGMTVFRSWLSQFFIAQVDFRFLLKVSLIAASTTMIMVGFAILADVDALLFSATIAVGEVVLMILTYRERKSVLTTREPL